MPPPLKPGTQIARGATTVNGSELLQLVNAVFWSEVAAASSLIESPELTPPVVLPVVELTPVTVVVELGVPVHVEFEKTLFVRVNVVPLGAAIAFTLPSVNVVCAVQPEVWPFAVARKVTP